MELAGFRDEQVQRAVDKLNHRPRNMLECRTPHIHLVNSVMNPHFNGSNAAYSLGVQILTLLPD